MSSSERFSDTSESTFTVSDSSALEIDNFAGSVSLVPGAPNEARVRVEKWASTVEDLDEIEVALVQTSTGIQVDTTNPMGLSGVGVDLDVTIPEDMRPTLHSAAGNVDYTGRPPGDCLFVLGSGSITLRFPADVNVDVRLSVAAGSIVVDFPVTGQVGDRLVEGTIGSGGGASVVAQVGAGTITVTPQTSARVPAARMESGRNPQ